MWRQLFPAHVPDDHRDRFVIAPHHADRLRRPSPALGAVADERFQQTLLWNVFRTLELVSPSFWLRRFHLRLTGEPSLVSPQIVHVHLWRRLPLPASQRVDGDRPDAVADVIIETEHAVWSLIAESERRELLAGEDVAGFVDAGRWFAGIRQYYCGVIESDDSRTSSVSTLQTRYTRSRDSARLQSATRGFTSPTRVHWGGIQWTELAALLQDCRDASNLPPIERALAANALDWLASVGVLPLPTSSARDALQR